MATTKQFRVKHGLDASNNNVSFVANPVNPQDAATKSYVDSQGAASNAYLTATFVTNAEFQSTIANLANTSVANATLVDSTVTFTRQDGSQFTLDVTAIQGEVSNAYLTSTFTANTDFQSYIANTNPRFDRYLEVANVSFAIQNDIDTAIANLVNSAPATLDTLAELANALSNNENFATEVVTNLGQKLGSTASVTLTGDVTGSGSFSANAVSITTTDTNLANTNTAIADRMQVANVISYTAKYLEVANTPANTSTSSATYTVANSTLSFTRADSSTFDVLLDTASVEVSNTSPSGANEGDLWWDNATGELYIYYANNWVEAVAQDVTPYTNNAILTTSNNTLTFVRTDGSTFDVSVAAIQGEVSNTYLTSTFVTNATYQTTVSDVSDRMQVANTRSLVGTRLGSNALVTLTGDISGTAKFNANAVSITTSLAQDITIPRDLTVTRNLTVEGDFQVTGNATTIFANNLLVQDNFIYLNKGGGNTNIDFGFAAGYNNGSYAHAGIFRDATDGRFKFFDQYIPEIYESVDVDTTDPSFALSQVQANTFIGDLTGTAELANTAVKLQTARNITLSGDASGTASFDGTGDASITVTVSDDFASNTYVQRYLEVANVVATDLSSYWPSANVIAYTGKYLEVANTPTSTTVSNTAPTIEADGALWWDNATGELYIAYANNWVEAVAQDVTPYTNNSIYTSGNTTLTFIRTDGSLYDVQLDLSSLGGGDVSNSYLTSTFVTNTVFQSYSANTNERFDRYLEVANANFATQGDIDTSIAALVNTAPTTLDTLNELAAALGDDPNFATTVSTNIGQKLGATATVTLTGDVSGSASFSANAVSITTTVSDDFASNTYVQRYQEVANASYVTANTIVVKNPDNYHRHDVTVATKTSSHPYFGEGSGDGYVVDGNESPSIILAPNQTYRFYQEDASNSGHPVVFYNTPTGGSYTNGVTQFGTPGSAGAYTQIVVDEDTPQVLYYMCGVHSNMGSVASVLTDTSPKYLEVANSTSFITSSSLSPYLEVANVSQYIPANTSTTSAVLSGNTATFTRADSSTFTLDLSSFSGGGGGGGDGASVTVSTTAPVSPSEGDLWYDSEFATMYIYYDSSWVEASPSSTRPNITVANTVPTSGVEGELYFDETSGTLFIYYDSYWIEVLPSAESENLTVLVNSATANGSVTAFVKTDSVTEESHLIVTVDGIVQRPTTDYTANTTHIIFTSAPSEGSSIGIRSFSGIPTESDINVNSFIVSDDFNSYVANTNATINSYVANTNARLNTLESSTTSYVEVTSNTTMVAGSKYIVGNRTANVFLTFPASATLGDEIRVIDGTGQANTYGIELLRNGHNIQGEAVDILIDTSRAAGGYVYYNVTQGWILTEV